MERQKFFTAGAGTAAALLLTAGAGTLPASAMSQLDSDGDVWRVRGRVEGILTQIDGLSSDYHGHRLAAISAYRAAKTALDAAVKVRGMNDALSNSIIGVAIDETTDMINRLSGDLGNYNGSKDVALTNLKAARESLRAALGM